MRETVRLRRAGPPIPARPAPPCDAIDNVRRAMTFARGGGGESGVSHRKPGSIDFRWEQDVLRVAPGRLEAEAVCAVEEFVGLISGG